MIEVRMRSFNKDKYETTVVLVDADKATILAQDVKGSTLEMDTLVLTKNNVEVAWFASWDHAVRVNNLMEYVDD